MLFQPIFSKEIRCILHKYDELVLAYLNFFQYNVYWNSKNNNLYFMED